MTMRTRRRQDRPQVPTPMLISPRPTPAASRAAFRLCGPGSGQGSGQGSGFAVAFALAMLAVALLAAPKPASAQGRLEAQYEATLAGIPVGKGAWNIDISDDQFSAAASGG